MFLDRDGVVVEDPGYLANTHQIRYIEGSLAAVRKLNEAGFQVILVTNQSGIARGYYGWPEFESVQNAIETKLADIGGWFDGVWACPSQAEHPFRKPQPGMLTDAGRALHVDLNRSAMVGDKIADLIAGIRAGVRMSILVETGEGSGWKSAAREMAEKGEAVTVAPNLPSAVEVILQARW